MRFPMARYYEHLQEIRSVKRAASYAKYLRKTLAFKNTDLGDLCVWVVAVVELPMTRALEHSFLRVGHWHSQSIKAPACAPRERSRARRRCARRPPPRFRMSTSMQPAERLLFVTPLAAKPVWRANRCVEVNADAWYVKQAFNMKFETAYWHVCKHRQVRVGHSICELTAAGLCLRAI